MDNPVFWGEVNIDNTISFTWHKRIAEQNLFRIFNIS